MNEHLSNLYRPRNWAVFFSLAISLTGCGVTDYQQSSTLQTLKVSLTDTQWDGKTIPNGQQCRKYGGDGHSPTLTVDHIPQGTEALIIEFSDRSWSPMNHGGHGKLGIRLTPQQQQVIVPSIASETFELPDKNLFIFHAHRGGRGEPGAYLPPCSGGRGNEYFADVKAVRNVDIDKQTAELLGEASLYLGKY